MIKVLFDHQKFTTQKYGGISRYFANILQFIKDTPDMDYELGVLYAKNHYLHNEHLLLNNNLGDLLLKQRSKPPYFINEKYCNYLLSSDNFDVFHPTYYDPYFLKNLKKPLVVTIHDLTYERLPEYFWAEDPLTYQKRLNLERADKIIAISNTTKKDLLRYYEVDESRIEVIYHGMETDAPFVTRPVAHLPKHYLLYVGDRSGYKNFYLFMNAFKQLSSVYPDLHLILTGGGNPGIADREFIHRLKLGDKVRHINATDEELNYLYQNAALFVYPSLHEGFGLPILEAYKAGCPVLLSDTECFREIGADAALFFSPHAVDDLISVITGFLSDSEKRRELVRKGTQRLGDFTLKESMEKTLDIYRALA
ncbi:glycosyltransferase family 4 protein [Larkinella soli]|uniref:glycosyltransferase family 4 protein n=1 Tax=Larkinella soli TaxID=1770527 RepID=UPI001E5EDA1B|nr:glycosyltransferase family 1 protein [Larkinella soli]